MAQARGAFQTLPLSNVFWVLESAHVLIKPNPTSNYRGLVALFVLRFARINVIPDDSD